MASINHLAEEMIFQILSLLPVLSLLQCKSVCKSWKSIISSPHFIQAHLTVSHKKQPPFSILRVVSKGALQEFFIDTCGESLIKLNLPGYMFVNNFHFRSCNGLVALALKGYDLFFIWNPLTRLFKMLPNLKTYPHCYNFGFGFGFDSVSNDYKILRVVLPGFSKNGGNVMVADLYSVNADSWKEIRVPAEMNCFWCDHLSHKYVCLDSGVLYIEGFSSILSFDLHDEVFGLIKYPHSGERISEVLDFEGSVAVIMKSSEEGSVLSLWTFDDVGGSFSWSKKFNIIPNLKIDYVNLYLGDGLFLARDIGVGYFFFDVKKGNKTPVAHLLGKESISPVQFSGSLVSLKGFERKE